MHDTDQAAPLADVESEELALGAVLLHPDNMLHLWGHADASWFTGRRAALWAVMEAMWGEGEAVAAGGAYGSWDLVATRDRVAVATGAPCDSAWLLGLMGRAPSRPTPGALRSLARHAYRRRLGRAAHELADLARTGTASLDDLTGQAECACCACAPWRA